MQNDISTLTTNITQANELLTSGLSGIQAKGIEVQSSLSTLITQINQGGTFVTTGMAVIRTGAEGVKIALNNLAARIASIPTPAVSVSAAADAGSKSIPKYANGGILKRTHIGMVAEAGPEAIIPLTRPNRALELWQQVGRSMGFFEDNNGADRFIPAPTPIAKSSKSARVVETARPTTQTQPASKIINNIGNNQSAKEKNYENDYVQTIVKQPIQLIVDGKVMSEISDVYQEEKRMRSVVPGGWSIV